MGSAALPPLIEAKLAAPGVRGGMVDRPRLWTGPAAGVDGVVTLVAAPAGYGKTTAVRAWCASQDAALAWVTLDADDNDPTRLWQYVATAVDRVRPGLGRGALQRLGIPGGSIEDAVDELMNGIAAFGERLLLVLDDLHAVTGEGCIESIGRALSHLPLNARVILVTRVDPALSLARYRAAGLLAELRARELAFTRAETHELLVTRGKIELGTDEIELLYEQTEGWPATLVLAGLWLRTVDDPAAAVRAFGGDHRFVAEYLSSEVLAALDEDQRSFLYGVAVLGEFTAELCDAVLERTGSSAVLAELERSNLLVSRLERGGWFRIHSLFAAYARNRARIIRAGRRDDDPAPSRRVAQIARIAHGSAPACGGCRRPRVRRRGARRLPPGTDEERRRRDVSSLGSHAAGQPLSSNTRSWRRPPRWPRCSPERARSSSAGSCSSPIGRRVSNTLSPTDMSKSG